MKKHLVFILIFLLSNTMKALGQCPTCDQALKNKTQDEFQTTFKRSLKDVLSEIFSNDYTEVENKMKSLKANLSSGSQYQEYFTVASSFFNLGASKEENSTKFQQLKEFYSRNHDLAKEDYASISQTIQSSTVYDNWLQCVKSACSDSFDGLILDKVVSGNLVSVSLYWQHNNTNDVQTLTNVASINMTPLPGNV